MWRRPIRVVYTFEWGIDKRGLDDIHQRRNLVRMGRKGESEPASGLARVQSSYPKYQPRDFRPNDLQCATTAIACSELIINKYLTSRLLKYSTLSMALQFLHISSGSTSMLQSKNKLCSYQELAPSLKGKDWLITSEHQNPTHLKGDDPSLKSNSCPIPTGSPTPRSVGRP